VAGFAHAMLQRSDRADRQQRAVAMAGTDAFVWLVKGLG
jgi:hypothetical protein